MRYELFCDVGPDLLLPDPAKEDVLFTTNPGPRPKDAKRLKVVLEWPPRPGTKHAGQVAQATQSVQDVGDVDVEIEQDAPRRPVGRPRKAVEKVDAVGPAKAGGVGKVTFKSIEGPGGITVDVGAVNAAMAGQGMMGTGKEFKYGKDGKLKS